MQIAGGQQSYKPNGHANPDYLTIQSVLLISRSGRNLELVAMKSTTTQVKQDINKHILSYFIEDMGWSSDDTLANLKEQLRSFDYMPTDYAKGVYMAEGGTFLIYTQDMEDFLNGLGINPDNKEFSEQQIFKQYCHLIGRQVAELVR